MDSVRIAVVIPTYNNSTTVAQVVSDAKRYCKNVIVINDGSNDETGKVLRVIEDIDLVEFESNRGKGAALRTGLEKAGSLGFTHAITMDADGQHLAEDLPFFISAVTVSPGTLWIGDRTLPVDKGAQQPARSQFGQRFGAFWYWFHTGLKIHDTQCGFRAYPLKEIDQLKCRGNRYEFEIEVLIKAAWNAIPVKSFPVHLFYHKPEERVSHFRPVRDFMRISVVNSKASLVRIFMPLRFINAPGKNSREKFVALVKRELRANTAPPRAAFSLAFGVFMAIFPVHGLQVFLVFALAYLLRLNRPLALIGVTVSSPPLLPFWIAAGAATGKALLPGSPRLFLEWLFGPLLPQSLFVKMFESHPALVNWIIYFAVGSIVLAFLFGIATFVIAYPVFLTIAKGRSRQVRASER